ALVEGAVAHRRVAGGLLVDLPLQIRRALDHEADSAQATDLGVLCIHQLEAAELLTDHGAVPHDRVSKRVTDHAIGTHETTGTNAARGTADPRPLAWTRPPQVVRLHSFDQDARVRRVVAQDDS